MSAAPREAETSAHLTVCRVRFVVAALAAHLDLLFDEGVAWDEVEGQRFLTDPSNLLVVAFWDDTPCGFVTAHRLQRFDRRRAEVLLYEIGVDDPYQRRGIGAALVTEVTSWAAEVGADEVWVLAEGEDDRARAFYRAIGGIADEQGAVMFTFPVAGES